MKIKLFGTLNKQNSKMYLFHFLIVLCLDSSDFDTQVLL